MLPRVVFHIAHRLFVLADYYNLLPGAFIERDPMFSSIFISNLGSMGIDAGYHHLYERGNCPIFLMIGKVNDRATRDGDATRWVKSMRIRVTFDERINDGLSAFRGVQSIKRMLEDPYGELDPIRLLATVASLQRSNRDGTASPQREHQWDARSSLGLVVGALAGL